MVASKTEKIEVRVTPEDKARIMEAARRNHRSVSSYVLHLVLNDVDESSEQQRIGLNAEQWMSLMEMLDGPPRDLPQVRELFSRPSVVETGLSD